MKKLIILFIIIFNIYAGEFSQIDQIVRETVFFELWPKESDESLIYREQYIWGLKLVDKELGCDLVVSGVTFPPSPTRSEIQFKVCIIDSIEYGYLGKVINQPERF